MSMTRKEAAKIIRRADDYIIVKENDGDKDFVMSSSLKEAVDLAVSALRTPTREQVERMRGEWIHDGPEFEGGTDWYHCSKCGVKETGVYVQSNFCSICGQPKTDKAVDIMMERWEEAVKNA